MSRKNILFIAAGTLLLAALVLVVFRQPAITVETVLVSPRTLVVEVQEQGQTRARDPYTVAAPIPGRLLRTAFDAGDRVEAGQVIARIALPPEDSRREAVLQASLVAAEAREAAASAALLEARGNLARARREEERRNELFKQDLTSSEEMELYRQASDSAEARVLSMEANLDAARAEIESARSMLLGTGYDTDAGVQTVTAPVSGTIYRLFEESERVVQAGAPLMAISNDDSLEIVVDLLTQDAVRVAPGDPVNITGWGGEAVLEATVRRIEPEAFTKVSTLGVEEQRVNVIADFNTDNPPLGAGYRVDAGIVVWAGDGVLSIATSAIFQRDNQWHTFVISDGRAQLRALTLGERNREHARVLDGVDAGERVVAFPTDIVHDGVRVRTGTD